MSYMEEYELADLAEVIAQREQQRRVQARLARKAERKGYRHLSWHLRVLIAEMDRHIEAEKQAYDKAIRS